MSNRKASELNKYILTLLQLGYTKEDQKVKFALGEIERELGLTFNQPKQIKDKNKALVIAIKDNSASMGAWENERSKEYCQLALNEIKQKYSDVELKFITHHVEADDSHEAEFFSIKGMGGTIVSSALIKLVEFLDTEREVIVIQFSDGDNLTSDCTRVIKLLEEEIISKVKYFKYVEVNQYNRYSTLMRSAYRNVKKDNFDCLVVKSDDDSLKGMRFGKELDVLED